MGETRANFVTRLAFAAAVCLGGLGLGVTASAQMLPQQDGAVHLGVGSCASSTCHGAATAFPNAEVRQNEHVTWLKEDKHAQAYKTLENEQSKRIAANLKGLLKGQAATEAGICLDCHADNVPADKRGATFVLSDGVGCEACHSGGAQAWLGVHISKAGHEANIKAGLFPTENPVRRAELCLSCHFGNENKFVTHQIMGAGHPRMSFELDTFTAIQPAHYDMDADYMKRKNVSNGAKTWAIGQAVATSTVMARLADSKSNSQGLFPELVFFDCHACHSPMSEGNAKPETFKGGRQWVPQPQVGLAPGMVRLNDANMVMMEAIAAQFDGAKASAVRQATAKLHAASQSSMASMVENAKSMRAMSDEMASFLATQTFDAKVMRGIFDTLVKMGNEGRFVDYSSAEQAFMALGSIADSLKLAGDVSEGQYAELRGKIDELRKAVDNDEGYNRNRFRQSLGGLKLASN